MNEWSLCRLLAYTLLTCVTLCSAERINQTVDIVKNALTIEEKGIKVRLTIIDTPGFGDAVNDTER